MKHVKNIFISLIILVMLISGTIIAQNYYTYIIKKGDNLTDIANNFNTTVEKITNINNITDPDIIIKGDRLKIPYQVSTYTIKKGDTLCKIASKFKTSLKKLISINSIKNPDKIMIGQKINILKDNERKRKLVVSRNTSLNFIWPVSGRISSKYGWRIHPITKKREFHKGIDIAVPIGSPVYAAEDGVVIYCGYSQGYGNLVIIKHRRSKKTYYAHNLDLIVSEGEKVSKGKIIAFSGSSGLSTGPHLHFEIRYGNRSENPMKYLNQKYLRNGFKV